MCFASKRFLISLFLYSNLFLLASISLFFRLLFFYFAFFKPRFFQMFFDKVCFYKTVPASGKNTPVASSKETK